MTTCEHKYYKIKLFKDTIYLQAENLTDVAQQIKSKFRNISKPIYIFPQRVSKQTYEKALKKHKSDKETTKSNKNLQRKVKTEKKNIRPLFESAKK